MKRVIINADDFGLSPGVNRGIVEALTRGSLSSTTLLVNLDGFADAVERTRSTPGLAVGIHLTLLWGAPVSDPRQVPSLVEAGGRFPRSLGTLARRYLLGRLSRKDVETEFRAQIRRFLDSGMTPTHADTHKHVHCLPGIMEALAAVTAEFDIRKIRCPRESDLRALPGARARPVETGRRRIPPPKLPLRARAKRDLVRFFSRGQPALMASRGIRSTDHFVGIAYQDALNSETFRFILQNVASGVTEIMCHPGYADEESVQFSRKPPRREEELRGLLAPEVADEINANAIELISYREL